MIDRFLVADIGGTNARFAIAERAEESVSFGFRVVDCRSFPVSQFENVDDAIAQYLASGSLANSPINGASLAVASPVGSGEIRFTNSHWRFSRQSLITRFKFQRLLIINDFEALAIQIPHSPPQFITQVRVGEVEPKSARVVVGPGTGLGVAGLIPESSVHGSPKWIPIPGEGGHVAFAPDTEIEEELLRFLRRTYGRVSIERVASGPGLTNIYNFLLFRAGRAASDDSPDAISKRALNLEDPFAAEAVNIFLGVVGAFSGDTALIFGAKGGVFLGGGILPQLKPLINDSNFFIRFNSKGRHSSWMQTIPVNLILSDQSALLGAAIALADHA